MIKYYYFFFLFFIEPKMTRARGLSFWNQLWLSLSLSKCFFQWWYFFLPTKSKCQFTVGLLVFGFNVPSFVKVNVFRISNIFSFQFLWVFKYSPSNAMKNSRNLFSCQPNRVFFLRKTNRRWIKLYLQMFKLQPRNIQLKNNINYT